MPLAPSTAGHRDPPALVCLSILECCAPCTGGSTGAPNQFFPVDFGLRHTTLARLFRKGSHKTVPRGPIFSIRQAFLYVAALQFVCPLTVRHHQLAPEAKRRSRLWPRKIPEKGAQSSRVDHLGHHPPLVIRGGLLSFRPPAGDQPPSSRKPVEPTWRLLFLVAPGTRRW